MIKVTHMPTTKHVTMHENTHSLCVFSVHLLL